MSVYIFNPQSHKQFQTHDSIEVYQSNNKIMQEAVERDQKNDYHTVIVQNSVNLSRNISNGISIKVPKRYCIQVI